MMSSELAYSLEQAEIKALVSRLSAIKQLPGNPMAVDVQEFGGATAFSVKNIPGPAFNTVKGLVHSNQAYIEDILRFYSEKEIPARFEITPAFVSTDLLALLAEKGFFQSDFHTSLYGLSVKSEQKNSLGITIRELKANEFDLFADIYVKGFGLPEFIKEGVAANNKVLHGYKGWTFYLASIDSEPAGIAVFYSDGEVGTMAASATLPTFQNRGVHQALIHARVRQARHQQCNLLAGQAKFGSISQRNMEKAGMRIAFTKAIWVKR